MYNIHKHGTWENHIADIIRESVKAGDVVLDIWANIGFDTMVMSQAVWPSGKVYSFEPSKKIFDILSENIYKINTFDDNIVLINKWAWSKIETVKLFMDDDNPGGTSICHNYGGSYESIDVITVDSLNLEKVNFIKMDIEGYEFEALQWMKELLMKNKDIKVVFEWSPQFYEKLSNDGRKYSIDILRFFEELWFTLYQLDIKWGWAKKRITDFDALYDIVWSSFWAHSDIYAVREN